MLRTSTLLAGVSAFGVSAALHVALLSAPVPARLASVATAPIATEAAPEIELTQEDPPREAPVAPLDEPIVARPTAAPATLARPLTRAPRDVVTAAPTTVSTGPATAPTTMSADAPAPRFVIPLPASTASAPSAAAPPTEPSPVDEPPYSQLTVDTRAECLNRVDPPYPPEARADGVSGDVVLELVVSTSGRVESARVEKGRRADLDEAAMAAVPGLRFSPAMRNGHAVRVRVAWTVTFTLR